MHSFIRSLLFAFFVALFVIGAPAIVLYTAGYRYNPQNGHIVRTGVLAVSSTPRGATVTWNTEDEPVSTPYVYNRVMPGTYYLTVEKEGYYPTVRKVSVGNGRTTYLSDVFLFMENAPSLLIKEDAKTLAPRQDGTSVAFLRRAKNSAEIWRYDIAQETYSNVAQFSAKDDTEYTLEWTHDGLLVVRDAQAAVIHAFTMDGTRADIEKIHLDDRISIIDNGQAVEVHANNTLIALLPSSTYTVVETDRSHAVITDVRGNLYFFDTASSSPLLLSTTATSYDWNRTLGRLTWTKSGIELHSFDIASRTSSFITRQSTEILGATWHSSGSAMLAATSSLLAVIAFEDGVIQDAQSLSDMQIESFWASDDGRYAYLFGTHEGVRGLYRLRLK